ncbi:MAG: aldose 1-epimerase family protein [Erysipelotrichia bacterium]|nr:aldose 1-epimerase family protein [Erysipelotrichia bacterium]
MSVFRLETESAIAEVTEQASEIISFKDKKTMTEHMWQGDPKYWAGRNPTLFPMVGSTWNKEIVIDGKVYHMGNHGFARHSVFTCIEHDEKHLIMHLEDSEETLAQYPFRFSLDITYMLSGSTLKISYAIINKNDRIMPFNFGLHPAFSCPLHEEEKQNEYVLKLNKPETFVSGSLNADSVTELTLDRERLESTIIISNPRSTAVTLTNGIEGTEVMYQGYEWIAFWSPENAPFICIEPWHSHGDTEKTEVPFEQREGTILLKAGDIWHTEYSIKVL